MTLCPPPSEIYIGNSNSGMIFRVVSESINWVRAKSRGKEQQISSIMIFIVYVSINICWLWCFSIVSNMVLGTLVIYWLLHLAIFSLLFYPFSSIPLAISCLFLTVISVNLESNTCNANLLSKVSWTSYLPHINKTWMWTEAQSQTGLILEFCAVTIITRWS